MIHSIPEFGGKHVICHMLKRVQARHFSVEHMATSWKKGDVSFGVLKLAERLVGCMVLQLLLLFGVRRGGK